MQRISWIILTVILCSACKNKASNDHLPPKVMQKILIDINLAETYSVYTKDNVHRGGMKNTDSLSASYKTIFSHYKITQDQFYNSLEWYKNHPDELDSIYSKMIPVAVAMQSKVIPPKVQVKRADTANTSKKDTAVNTLGQNRTVIKKDSLKNKANKGKKQNITSKVKIHSSSKRAITDSAYKK